MKKKERWLNRDASIKILVQYQKKRHSNMISCEIWN